MRVEESGTFGGRPSSAVPFPRAPGGAAPALAAAGPPSKPPSRPPTGPSEDDDVVVEERQKTAVPKRWRVIFHNDDYTTMEYVVLVLMQFFHKSEAEAFHLMLTVHKKGNASVGLYPRDVAETKVDQVTKHAREHGMPLMVTAEPE